MAIPDYQIFVRDRNFKKTKALKYFSKLELHLRFQDAGSFILTMPNDGNSDVTAMINAYNNGAGYGGIVVVRGGTIIFSGPIRGFEADGDFTSIQDQETITFFGIDDTGLLASRICMVADPNYPQPAQPPPPQGFRFYAPYGANSDNYTTPYTQPPTRGWGYYIYPQGDQSDPENQRSVSEVMYSLISNNIGPTSPYGLAPFQNRRITNLQLQGGVYGPNYVTRVRYENLLAKIREAALYIPGGGYNYRVAAKGPYEGLGFKIIQLDTNDANGNGQIQYSAYEPNDYSNSVIFSKEYRNLSRYRYTNKAPEGNYVTLGGMNNTPVNRTVAPLTKYTFDVRRRWFFHTSSTDSVNKYGLWEYFIDRRDIQYPLPGATGVLANDPIFASPPVPGTTYYQMAQEVNYALVESLVEMRNLIDVDIETIDIAPTRFLRDYNIGDKVSVIIPGPTQTYTINGTPTQVAGYLVQERIRDIHITLSYPDSEKITCRIGTNIAGTELNLFKKMKKTGRRVSHLDSSY